MIRLARLSIRRPKAVLAFWAVVAVVLGLIGFGVEKSLSPSVTVVPGTESSRAAALANSRFGPSDLVPILLEGPKAQLDKQGPVLVKDLAKRAHTRVLSAWDAGAASAGLRPKPTAAMIIASVDRAHKDVVLYDQKDIEALVAKDIKAPVKSSVSGMASIDRAFKSHALDDTRTAEIIAIGVLFLLLLVGFRAPVAAVLVTAVAVVTMLASMGVMTIMGKFIEVDALSYATGTMTGMVMGVAFSMLILDRFHEEELGPPGSQKVRDATLAASRAVSTAGVVILVIGTGIVGDKLLSNVLGTTKVLTSLGIGAATCELMATGAAVIIMPAALVLLGHGVNRWSFGAPSFLSRAWARLVGGGSWVTRNAIGVGALTTALLAALVVPAFAIDTGPPGVGQLPKNDKARLAFEEIARVMGPGYPTPYNIVIASNSGPITTTSMLAALDSYQAQIIKNPSVASVQGPGQLNANTKDLGKLSPALDNSAKLINGSKKDLATLQAGLGLAGAGASQLQGGLSQAANGAGQLHSGSGAAESGSAQLHAGLIAAHNGSAQLSAGLGQALAGATALKSGAAQALAGSGQLTAGLNTASTAVNSGQEAFGKLASTTKETQNGVNALKGPASTSANQISAAQNELAGMTAGKNEPQYAAAVAALSQALTAANAVNSGLESTSSSAGAAAFLGAGIAQQGGELNKGLIQLHNGAAQLQAGLSKLSAGNAQLATGINQLNGGGGQLTSGLSQLQNGAGQLVTGLGQLTNGTGQLESGLAGGVGPAGQLVNGLGVMEAGVAKFRGSLPSTKDLEKLKQQSPGLFNSGYFMLAAVSGAPPADRNAATFMLNLDRGGSAGQIVVISKYTMSDPRTSDLGDYLSAQTKKFAGQHNAVAAVGGPAGNLADFSSSADSKIPWVIAGLMAFLLVLLMVALRAVLLPIVATAIAALVIAAGFGVMQILFGGSNPPLGGPGYLDPVSFTEIFVAEFGIPLIFMIMLLMRAREEFLRTGDAREGLGIAMRKTAAVATGMGVVMLAAIGPFVTTGLIPVREIGIAVAIVIVFDIFIVRPVLLPAAMQVMGRVGWLPTRAAAPAGPAEAGAAPAPVPAPAPAPGAAPEPVPEPVSGVAKSQTGKRRRFVRRPFRPAH